MTLPRLAPKPSSSSKLLPRLEGFHIQITILQETDDLVSTAAVIQGVLEELNAFLNDERWSTWLYVWIRAPCASGVVDSRIVADLLQETLIRDLTADEVKEVRAACGRLEEHIGWCIGNLRKRTGDCDPWDEFMTPLERDEIVNVKENFIEFIEPKVEELKQYIDSLEEPPETEAGTAEHVRSLHHARIE